MFGCESFVTTTSCQIIELFADVCGRLVFSESSRYIFWCCLCRIVTSQDNKVYGQESLKFSTFFVYFSTLSFSGTRRSLMVLKITQLTLTSKIVWRKILVFSMSELTILSVLENVQNVKKGGKK